MENKIIIFMPVIGVGGVEKNFFIIANNFAKKYNNLTVVTSSQEAKKKLNKKINFVCPKKNLFTNLSRRLQFLICIFYLIPLIIFNKKVLVFCFQANMYCVFICKLFGVKVILRSNSSPTGWSKNFVKKFFYKLGYGLANGIIVNSIQFKKELKKKFGINSTNIYNPLDYKEIIFLSKKKINLNFFKQKQLNIINVARFEDQKDHDTLLRAVNTIKKEINFKLLLIGTGSKELKIRNYIKLNNLNKNIKILKNITNPYPYIIKSDLVVLSSIYEGLPNILLESIALKKFIISSDCPTGPSEILENGKLGILFKLRDYNELAKKILFYNKNQKILKRKIFLAKKSLIKYNYNKNVKKYFNFINKHVVN